MRELLDETKRVLSYKMTKCLTSNWHNLKICPQTLASSFVCYSGILDCGAPNIKT